MFSLKITNNELKRENQLFVGSLHTNTTTSLVARASISAQETLFVHRESLSTAALALITVSNPSPARERSSG